jgi:hypothetical protein
MITTIQLRRDFATNWVRDNTVLNQGEVGVETDTSKAKIGDGITAWNSLPYWNTGGVTGGVTSVFNRTGAVLAVAGDYTAAQVTNAADKSSVGTQSFAGSVSAPALSSTGLVGAASASRYVGATASGAPTTGTFAIGDFVIDQTGKIWICTVAGTPGTWATSLSIQPWQFTPEANGGKGDRIIVSDAAITTGTATLACTTSTPFTSTTVDGGKAIYIVGAGAAGADYVGTISTVTDSGHAVLSANAGTTVSGKGCVFGTDNTAAIKAAQSAAVTYAQTHAQYAEILFPSPTGYVVSGAATVGGATLGNAIFPFPIIPGTSPKITLAYRGPGIDVNALPHWLQTSPQAQGACITILRLDGTLDGTFGIASVFGGPFQGYGGAEGGTFDNLQVIVDGVSLLVPFNSTFGGWDFWGVSEAYVKNGAFFCLATVPSGTGWPQYVPANISHQWSYALRMPSKGNNARSDVGYWSAYGATYGFMPSEHCSAVSVRTNYNINGIEGYDTGVHAARIMFATSEANTNAVGFLGPAVKMDIETLDVEGNNQTIYDPSGFGVGTIGVRGLGQGYFTTVGAGGGGLRILNLDSEPGAVTSPQAPPASTVAWLNGYYWTAEITLSVSGGTLSALTITGPSGAVAQVIPASTTFYRFTLPPGASYTPTFTGTLTHTVTLL